MPSIQDADVALETNGMTWHGTSRQRHYFENHVYSKVLSGVKLGDWGSFEYWLLFLTLQNMLLLLPTVTARKSPTLPPVMDSFLRPHHLLLHLPALPEESLKEIVTLRDVFVWRAVFILQTVRGSLCGRWTSRSKQVDVKFTLTVLGSMAISRKEDKGQ